MSGRRALPHELPHSVDPAREIWFVTICTLPRGETQLTRPEISRAVLDAVKFRYRRGQWYPWIFLLMPDHCHALLSFPQDLAVSCVGTRGAGGVGTRGDGSVGTRGAAALPGREGAPRVPTPPGKPTLSGKPTPPTPASSWPKTIRDWKHWLAAKAGVRWQTDFFDHRLRHDESFAEKAAYILHNPVRAGLVARWEDWPHRWQPPDALPFTTLPR
jgi:REP element-mobilizing transposase RayT